MSNGKPRRSIFGAVLFIAVGAALLAANLSPEFRFWVWFVDYWPVLLILWGMSKLFDYFASRRSGDMSPRTLSGGEVFLIVLLIIAGICVSGARHFIAQNPEIWEELEGVGTPHTTTEELAQPVKPGSQIVVNTDRGDINVHPQEGDQLRVVVKKTARAFESSDAERRAQSVRVAVQEVPGGYEIIPKADGGNLRAVRIDLEVHVPKNSSIRARTERGNVQMSGIQGAVNVVNSRGSVELRSIVGEVAVEMRRGNLRVNDVKGAVRITGRGSEVEIGDVTGEASVQGEFYGPIRLKNVAKEVRFLSQRSDITISQLPGRLELGGGDTEIYDTPGNVSVTTREKDVILENVGGRINITNRRGDVKVRLREAPKEPIEIVTESAGVTLAMPGKSTFDLKASSRQGEVTSDFQGPDLKVRADDNNNALEGKIGARGPSIQVRTTYGSVQLRKID